MYQNGTTQYFKTKFFVYLGLFLILSFKFSYIILEMIFFVMSKDTLPIFIFNYEANKLPMKIKLFTFIHC